MTVGEALTEARYQAGLSVDELSQRTRIRETVIRSIERDDYAACGGDLYVRGYVRAIAGAVGIDAQPLIREYDMIRAGAAAGGDDSAPATGQPGSQEPGVSEPDATALDLPPVPPREPDATALDLPLAPRLEAEATMPGLPPAPADPAETRFDLPPVTDDGPTSMDLLRSEDPAATRYDLPLVREPDLMAAGYEVSPADGAPSASASASAPPWPAPPWSKPSPGARSWPAARITGAMQGPPVPRHGTRGRNRRLPALAVVAVALVLAAAGFLIAHLASGGTATGRLASAASPRASATAKAPAAKPAKARSTAKPATKPTATPTAKPAPPVTSLHIAAAEAFGPAGLADGDNPQAASFAIARNAPQPWSTDWYLQPEFGGLKKGTGLLLDLGHTVTITSVRVDLSQFRGVNLELKAGDGTAPGDFTTVATVSDTGGVLRLTLHQPATDRYLLIWFTLLPPNGNGQFQESVSVVLVNGRA